MSPRCGNNTTLHHAIRHSCKHQLSRPSNQHAHTCPHVPKALFRWVLPRNQARLFQLRQIRWRRRTLVSILTTSPFPKRFSYTRQATGAWNSRRSNFRQRILFFKTTGFHSPGSPTILATCLFCSSPEPIARRDAGFFISTAGAVKGGGEKKFQTAGAGHPKNNPHREFLTTVRNSCDSAAKGGGEKKFQTESTHLHRC